LDYPQLLQWRFLEVKKRRKKKKRVIFLINFQPEIFEKNR
jgi:hypothetical protein